MRSRKRFGVAIVEFAVCAPLMFLLILGSLEATSAIFLRQALATSAYEGIREATKAGGLNADAIAHAQAILTTRKVRSSSIRFNPSDTENVPRGNLVEVIVTAQFSANSPFVGKVISDRTITVKSVMVKE